MTLGARRNRKRFSKNAKKGYDSSSSSSSSESSSSSSSSFYDSDAPNRRIKKAKKAEDAFPGSKASKPICIDSEDDSSIATLGYGVQKIEDPPIIKKEMKSCPIKPENDPTTLTSTEPYLHRRSPSVTITGENPCVRYTPFMKVGGELSDPTVAKEPDNEKKGFLFSKRP
ncbi:hypothetical protein PHISCL_04894 [Aspergillus sclerotialis]|uniref:Uncharacterized protein n=1 Tax=Aspergillus sclerotialis TaxID=2070753 RepID=A0A3A2ZHP5_9EURO|nr:hypothetical protein PHISCL_04894 [Aspergillus sclerotialis]